MSNQVYLYVTNLSSPQDVYEDDNNDGDRHEVLLETPGNVPALLWIPMFKDSEWQDVLVSEEYEEGSTDANDHIIKMPIVSISQAIKNLEESESNISKYFYKNGGVKRIVEDLVKVLESSDMKNIVFYPRCGDFDYSRDVDNEIISNVLKISAGDFSINTKEFVRQFDLVLVQKKLFSSKPVIFESLSESLYEDGNNNKLINLYILSGVVDDVL